MGQHQDIQEIPVDHRGEYINLYFLKITFFKKFMVRIRGIFHFSYKSIPLPKPSYDSQTSIPLHWEPQFPEWQLILRFSRAISSKKYFCDWGVERWEEGSSGGSGKGNQIISSQLLLVTHSYRSMSLISQLEVFLWQYNDLFLPWTLEVCYLPSFVGG